MKTVLVLGAGRGQVALYKAAKEKGARTVAISIPGDYPGFEHADEIEYVDILDKEGVVEVDADEAFLFDDRLDLIVIEIAGVLAQIADV